MIRKKSRQLYLWPFVRRIVGLVSLTVGITALSLTLRTVLGQDITRIDLGELLRNYIQGMFGSWFNFAVKFWFILSFVSKLTMILDWKLPASLISSLWFVWFIVFGSSLSGSKIGNFVLDDKILEDGLRVFLVYLEVFLLTDILDSLFWVSGWVESWFRE